MKDSTAKELGAALWVDLDKARPQEFSDLIFEPKRKIFRTKKSYEVFEFPSAQPDMEYWNGVKIYSSGRKSRVRFRRSPQ